MDMKATGIVRRADQCVIIGRTEAYWRNARVVADFVRFSAQKVCIDRFCYPKSKDVHTDNFPCHMPQNIPDGICHTVRDTFTENLYTILTPPL